LLSKPGERVVGKRRGIGPNLFVKPGVKVRIRYREMEKSGNCNDPVAGADPNGPMQKKRVVSAQPKLAIISIGIKGRD
jgi:hypothetical protein